MKTRIITLLVLCCSLITSHLTAQGEYSASPQNYAEVGEDILSHYAAGINITGQKLFAHLKTVVKEQTYSQDCKIPKIDGTSQEGDNVIISWEGQQDWESYIITYLNMATGQSKSFDTADPSMALTELPDAMYMISVVGKCGAEGEDEPSSGAHIIILDKPILIINNPFVDCPCRKLNLQFEIDTDSNPLNPITFPWAPEAPWHYFLRISYPGGLGSSVVLAAVPNPNAPPDYRFKGQCMAYLNYGYSLNANTFFGPGPSNSLFSLYLSPLDYSWTLDDPSNLIEKISMYRCSDRIGNDGDGRSLAGEEVDIFDADELFPNPAQEMVTIRHQSKGAATSLRIINELGQLMHEGNIPEYANQLEVNIADWPAGHYHVTLIEGRRTMSQPFVKIRQQ